MPPSTQEAEAGGLQVQGQCGVHSENFVKERKREREKERRKERR
jgi:hypothetical protein